jgi:hypothetical protein
MFAIVAAAATVAPATVAMAVPPTDTVIDHMVDVDIALGRAAFCAHLSAGAALLAGVSAVVARSRIVAGALAAIAVFSAEVDTKNALRAARSTARDAIWAAAKPNRESRRP